MNLTTMMINGICRSVLERNLSSLSTYKSSTISELGWITNSISLFISFIAFLGNSAALFIMISSRGRAKSTHDKYLVNLAVADLLRSCFIPFTAIARMKRNFIFGKTICRLLPIVQGVGVSVDVFTLVCICIERYIAICHPFFMLKLKSMSYCSSFKNLILVLIWTLGFLTALPNFYMHDRCFLPTAKRYKCERIPLESPQYLAYIISIDVLYFVIPMTVMSILYTLTIMKMSDKHRMTYMLSSTKYIRRIQKHGEKSYPLQKYTDWISRRNHSTSILALSILKARYRDSGTIRMDRRRRKALKLLIVLIMTFFICWIPLYTYQTIGTFDKGFYRLVPSIVLDIILLLSFISTLCNPITYYFMSERYRTVIYERFHKLKR